MLKSLAVKNLALIEECELDFSKGLNVLTGETGAGKSVLLGSINLALGSRVETDVIRRGASEASITLVFSADENVHRKLKSLELSCDDDEVVIVRKITAEKSVFKVNGEVVPAKLVKEIAEELIDIHGQHEHQSLLNNNKQMEILDAFAGDEADALKEQVSQSFKEINDIQKEIDRINESRPNAVREISLIEYELKEIEEANLEEGEDEQLESSYRKMKSAEKLTSFVNEAVSFVSMEGADNAGELISRAISRIKQAASLDESLEKFLEGLETAESLIGDFAMQASRYIDDLSFDEQKFVETEQRLDLINGLKSKFGNSVNEIIDYSERRAAELEFYQKLDEEATKYAEMLEVAKKRYFETSNKLTNLRLGAAVELSKALSESLSVLAFVNPKFEVKVTTDSQLLSGKGQDSVEFLFGPNPGEPVKPLKLIASGGELSRVMLAIKTLMAQKDAIDTLIFDEIDAGISGKTAWEVAGKLSALSKKHQVILITHLAQIAAMNDRHFEILKETGNDFTKTTISQLSIEGSEQEIARLVGAGTITESALNNARELINTAKAEKEKQ